MKTALRSRCVCRQDGLGDPLPALPDHDHEGDGDVSAAQAVEQQVERLFGLDFAENGTRPGEHGRTRCDVNDPPVKKDGVGILHGKQAQSRRIRCKENLGRKGEKQQVVAHDQVNRYKLISQITFLEEKDKKDEGGNGEHGDPQGLQDQMRHDPPEKLQPPQSHGGQQPFVEAPGRPEKKPPLEQPRRHDRKKREQGQQKSADALAAGQLAPGIAQVVGFVLCRGEGPGQLFHQGRGIVGQPEEKGPQSAFPAPDDHPVLIRGGLGRRLMLEHLAQHLPRLLVAQRGDKSVHLLRALRQSGNGHLHRPLLGLRGLGFRHLLRLCYSSQGDDCDDEQTESCHFGRGSHLFLLSP